MKNTTKKNQTQTLEVSSNKSPRLGRPVDPNSERQKRLAELDAKRKNGELKRGRPVVEDSARQKRLAEMEARKAANGGTVKRGRPKMIKTETEQISEQ